MRMKANFIGEKNYLPWDVLQLNEDIDGGWRTYKNSIALQFYRTYRRSITWRPVIKDNMAYFYNTNEHLKEIIELWIKQVNKKCSQSVELEFYNFDNQNKEYLLNLDKEYPFFGYHPFPAPIKTLITELQQYRERIKELSLDYEYHEPPNKKLVFIMIHLTEKQKIELKNNIILTKQFINLIKESYNQRIYITLYSANTQNLPPDIIKAFDFAAFIGEENSKKCTEEYYSNKTIGQYSVRQEQIGMLYDKDERYLIPAYHRKYTPSAYQKAQEEYKKKEEKTYREFLSSLSNGEKL